MGEALGLVILGTKVLVDHSSREHLITTLAGNPKQYTVENEFGSIDVFSVFTRLKATSQERRDRPGRKIGDNCPMIYALKGKDGLTTGYRSVREMLLIGEQIVRQHLVFRDPPVIVCIPSSHSIVRHVAEQLGKHLQLTIVDGLLAKATVASAVADLDRAISSSKSYSDRKALQNIRQVVNKQQVLALKDVHTRFRHLIQPIAAGPQAVKHPYSSILLVDDLVSSGTSLIAAKNVLRSTQQGQSFTALSLFSKA